MTTSTSPRTLWRLIVVGLSGCLVAALTVVISATPASAGPPCPGSSTFDETGAAWPATGSSSSAHGARAAITARLDGAICNLDDGAKYSTAADVVGLRSPANSEFVEGGVVHYQWKGEAAEYCIWGQETGGTPTLEHCGDLSGGTQYFIKTEEYQEDSGQWDVVSWYCGTSDFSTCESVPVAFTLRSAFSGMQKGYEAVWTNYGGSGCTSQIMGGSSNHVVIGNSSGGTGVIAYQESANGPWVPEDTAVNWVPTCSDYQRTVESDTEVDSHDSRL